MAEKDVAKKLEQTNRDVLWKNNPDKYGTGVPDRSWLFRLGISGIAELKFLLQLPKKKCKVGLKRKQAAWLQEWKDWGGHSFLIVGVGSDAVAIFSDNFMKIANEGIARQDFTLIEYQNVSSVMRGMIKDEKKG